MRDWLATIPIVLLVPALILLSSESAARPQTTLKAPAQAEAGTRITLTGYGFPGNTRIQVTWDGTNRGMPTVTTNRRGELRVRLTVPSRSPEGNHTLAARRADVRAQGRDAARWGSSTNRRAASNVLASVRLQVVDDDESARGPSATATPRPAANSTATPRPTAVPTATAATPAPVTGPVATPRPPQAPQPTPAPAQPTARPAIPAGSAAIGEILISRSRLMSLPTSGGAWNTLVSEANSFGRVNLADQDDSNDVRLLAKALVTVRTGGDLGPIYAALAAVPGTEDGGRTLALGRNLMSVVLAADLVGYRDPAFVNWLRGVLRESLDGMTLISTHENRPNNWGTHAGASRIAADLYLGDGGDLGRAAAVFRGWLGERGAYAGFDYGDLDWQSNPNAPVGINPAGATIDGRNVDGVLPDDQRRGGGFTWPAPAENYVYEALQGALLQAELLNRAGYPAYDWSNQALRRAYTWLHNVAGFPADGDDRWQMTLVNARYGSGFPASSGSLGKNFGFTDWLYR